MKVARSLGRTPANGPRIGREQLLPAMHAASRIVRLGGADRRPRARATGSRRRPARPGRRGRTRRQDRAPESASWWRRYSPLYAVLIGTATAPPATIPHQASIASLEFSMSVATRSPLAPRSPPGRRRSARRRRRRRRPRTSPRPRRGTRGRDRTPAGGASRSSTVSCSPLIHTSELMGDEPYGYSTTSESCRSGVMVV